MKRKYVLFDLDGVVSDSKEGITKSVDYALRQFGIVANSPDEYESFVGPPLLNNFKKECNFTDEEAKKAVEYYRVYYTKQGIDENELYKGMDTLMKALYEREVKIILATSKPEEFARHIVERYGILPYFYDVCGSSMDNTRVKKEDVIAYAMEKNKISSPDEVIMVGDRMHDIVGAHIHHIDCIAVEYGYGTLEEFSQYKPAYQVKTISDLQELLLKLC